MWGNNYWRETRNEERNVMTRMVKTRVKIMEGEL